MTAKPYAPVNWTRVLRKQLYAFGLGSAALCREAGLLDGANLRSPLSVTTRLWPLALLHMCGPRCSIREVASLLGFSDSRCFARACKHWLGQTPSQYRDGLKNA